MRIQNVESNINKSKAASQHKAGPAKSPRKKKLPEAQFLFDALPEYLAYVKERGATEVFLTAMTNPNIHGFTPRDPRADVFHVVLSARDSEGLISTFVNATELTATDNIARRKAFPELMENELAPYVEAVEAAGFTVRRGRVLPGKPERKKGESSR